MGATYPIFNSANFYKSFQTPFFENLKEAMHASMNSNSLNINISFFKQIRIILSNVQSLGGSSLPIAKGLLRVEKVA